MNLALKGHKTRGADVIKLLEMLGGNNRYHINTTECNLLYTIREGDNVIIGTYPNSSISQIYTLEQFLEKFPYKIGDKVITPTSHNIHTIESIRWKDDKIYYNTIGEGFNTSYTAKDLKFYKEKTSEVTEEFYNKYCANCGSQRCTCSGEWLKECEHYKKQQDTMEKKYNIEDYLKVCKETENELEFVVNDGFEFKIDNGKFFLTKKQSPFPQTYEECCKILNIHPEPYLTYTWNMTDGDICSVLTQYHEDLVHELDYLRLLLVCRNAYWKHANDWKPDWKNGDQSKFVIAITKGEIEFNKYHFEQKILAFPTEEMLHEFYKNFKDWIDVCMRFL